MLGLLLLSKREAGSTSRGPGLAAPQPQGRAVAVLRTGEADPVAWARRRLALLVVALQSLEPPLVGAHADQVARSLLAQWAHETNSGRSEFNFNLGGWTARRGDHYHTAADRLSGASGFRWTAYADLPTAIEDQLRRLILTYPRAWSSLLAAPESRDWIDELSRGGYFTAPRDDYARAWRAHRAELGKVLP